MIAADAGEDLPYARAEEQVIAGGSEGGAARVLAGRGATAAWPVEDISTSLLMGEFYRRHIGLQHDSARALRGAQRWLRGLDRDAPLTALPLDGHDGRPGEG